MPNNLKGFAVAGAAVFFSLTSSAAQTIEVTPGLWALQSEIWANGKSMTDMAQQIRDKLPPTQRQHVPDPAAVRQECIAPEEAKIDPRSFFDQAMGGEDAPTAPRRCVPSKEKFGAGKYESDFECTERGGITRGHITIDFSATTWRVETKARGKANGAQTGMAPGTEMEMRSLSTGKWIAAECTPASKKQAAVPAPGK
jgi:hypothetical protein